MLHGRDWNLSGALCFLLLLGCTRVHAPASPLCPAGLSEATGAIWPTFEGAASTAALSFPATRPHPGPVISTAACRLELPGGQMRVRCHPHLPPQQSEMHTEGSGGLDSALIAERPRVQPRPCPDSPPGVWLQDEGILTSALPFVITDSQTLNFPRGFRNESKSLSRKPETQRG